VGSDCVVVLAGAAVVVEVVVCVVRSLVLVLRVEDTAAG
jgi:hypothetical protein